LVETQYSRIYRCVGIILFKQVTFNVRVFETLITEG